jgi:hypothetical protein
MPRTVTFNTLVLEQASIRTQGSIVQLEVAYHLEDSTSSKALGPYSYLTSSQEPGSVLADPFSSITLPPNADIAAMIMALRDYIRSKLSVVEGI